MSRAKRAQLIDKIQKERRSLLITYITSTRPNFEVPMAMDQIRIIYDHIIKLLEPMNTKPSIDLFLYTNGGDGTVPWRLVTLLRGYASKFSVLIPFRCFSAGTLTALGADEIIMHPMGILGPTDPTAANQFNPDDPLNPGQKIGINVEDVVAYLALLKEDAGIHHEDELIQGVNILAQKVHPLALGNVKRLLSQSKIMAKKLLYLHMKEEEKSHKVDEIVDKLTSKLYFHGHPINRLEAKNDIGIENIKDPSERLEKLMWDLYLEYENEMKLTERFDLIAQFLNEFPDQNIETPQITSTKIAKLAYIESINMSDVYVFYYSLSGTKRPDGRTEVMLLKKKEGWEKEQN